MNQIENIFYDNVGGRVWSTYGKEYAIKKHSNWQFINVGKDKIGINSLEKKIKIMNFDDFTFMYIFKGLSQSHPCLAMDYLIFRRQQKKKITPQQYLYHFKNTK